MTMRQEEEESIIFPIMSDHQFLRRAVSDVTNETSKLGQDLETIVEMEMEMEEEILEVECECCGLKEECTKEYISRIRTSFSGRWVCGLCTEAVKERADDGCHCPVGIEDAIMKHKNFVQDFNTTTRVNPKLSLAWTMMNIAKRNCERRNTSNSGGIKIMRSSSCAARIN